MLMSLGAATAMNIAATLLRTKSWAPVPPAFLLEPFSLWEANSYSSEHSTADRGLGYPRPAPQVGRARGTGCPEIRDRSYPVKSKLDRGGHNYSAATSITPHDFTKLERA
jgi:hypothetical protein